VKKRVNGEGCPLGRPASAPQRRERRRKKAKKEEAANPYRTHTSLLLSTHSLRSPISCRPPSARVCVRPPVKVENKLQCYGPHASLLPSEAGAPVLVLSVAEESGGISGPDPQTNEMQGHRISFCGHCGAELKPQITRRGHRKRYCSDACRAKAWRQRNAKGKE